MAKLASKIMKLSLFSLVLMALVLTSYTTANASHRHEKHPCTQLWIYTQPVQKGPCVVFKHPSGHELEKANKANIEFNKGVEAGSILPINSTALAIIPKSFAQVGNLLHSSFYNSINSSIFASVCASGNCRINRNICCQNGQAYNSSNQ
jgi:hypothetical protein